MTTIYTWLLVLLIATNVFTILFVVFLIYLVAGILDLTYHQRHKSERNNNCPDFIDREDKRK